MADNAKRDENFVTTIIGVSEIDETTPVTIAVDPVTHEVLVKPAGTSNTTQYATRVDETTTADVIYLGKAAVGSTNSTSSAVWQIKKIDQSSGTVISWADGTSAFTKIWNNRSSYTYA